MSNEAAYDIIIAGGGYAGLTCARHLALEVPDLKTVIVEPQRGPLPRFAHKVGESSLGPQGTYLAGRLGLRDYLESQHVEKFGVRYFFSDVVGSFSERPEVGGERHFDIREYQFDRGKLENDLRKMNVDQGVRLLEGYRVSAVNREGDDHIVSCRSKGAAEDVTLRGRWLIDATGRQRLLHGKTARAGRGQCSAAWWRVEGWVDVDDFVPESERGWRSRVSQAHPRCDRFGRVNSTNHLCGPGYWVWLIPLPDDGMSVGIVATEAIVPFSDYNTYPRALRWLRAREPQLADVLEDRTPLDFKTMARYSYAAGDVLPGQRMGAIGEAVGFTDPFYSPGGDAIAVANTLVVEAIKRDAEGGLSEASRSLVNGFFASYLNGYAAAIESIYPCLGYSRLSACRIIWDFCSLVSVSERILQEPRLIEQLENSDITDFMDQFLVLTRSVDEMCLRYAGCATTPKHPHVAPLQRATMVNHRDAFLALVANAERLLRWERFRERATVRASRLLGRSSAHEWNRKRHLEVLRLIASGLRLYLAERASNESNTDPDPGAGLGSARTSFSRSAADPSGAPRSSFPGLLERLANDARFVFHGLRRDGRREQLLNRAALELWKAAIRD